MIKFTEGPWVSEKPRWTDPSRCRHIYDQNGMLIARVDYANARQSENEAIANADLIAAAPNLYVLAKIVVDLLDEESDGHQALLENEAESAASQERHPSMDAIKRFILDRARTAIAKAEGG